MSERNVPDHNDGPWTAEAADDAEASNWKIINTPRAAAPDIRNALRRLVVDVLRHRHGDAAVVRSRIAGTGLESPADPLVAAYVANSLLPHIRALTTLYVKEGRAGGQSWLDIASALGVEDDEWCPEEAAFAYIAGKPNKTFQPPVVSWRCGTCDGWVLDRGPQCGPHPDDRESGHLAECQRHNAEVEQYLEHLESE